MGRHDNDKIRLLAVYTMITQREKINATEILRELDLKYDIRADRKTIYSDIYAINRFIPIESIANRNGGFRKYHMEE